MNTCIFGDSITWGAHDFEKGGWVERLKSHCLENHNGVDVYNLGISGNTTEDMLKRLESEARTREPKVIIFAVGINDSLYIGTKENHKVDLDKFKDNLSKLAGIAKTITDTISFVGLTRVDESKTMSRTHGIPERYYENKSIDEYDSIIREFCKQNNLDYIDMREVIGTGDLEDGLHPNSKGHEKMFKAISEVINRFFSNNDGQDGMESKKVKSLKFRHELVKDTLEGRKTVTWRLFDEKSLQVGDMLKLIDSETGKQFSKAEIISVREKKLKDVNDSDFTGGHLIFSSHEEMLKHYRDIYGEKVTMDTPIKMISFKLL